MQVSYKWLSEYVDLTNISPSELAEKMSRTGIEVEEVWQMDANLKKIIVGEVVECVDHPNSDHLHICQVNIGEEVTQIVCGAPNVAAGQKVIVALPGARIVDNVKIKKGKIRGEVSNGMLCSLEELGIPTSVIPKEESDGIYILPTEAVPGTNALPLVEMDDAILDLAITPNRADALSMRGVAYETAAIYNKDLQLPNIQLQTTEISNPIAVNVVAKEAVPIYATRYIKGVKIQPSPRWLQFKLMHMGIKPINNVVDITNYVMLLLGQPLHAYDADKINGDLTVRYANEGEKFQALNDEDYELQSTDLVIADDGHVLALGGVIGGLQTSVTEATTNVCLEAALFDATTIRKTSQAYHLRTDASQRFEKGIDEGMVLEALDVAASLLSKYAEGEVAYTMQIGNAKDIELAHITITLARINQVLGIELAIEDIEQILKALRFEYRVIDNVIFEITVPSRRFDIKIEADIIEEIVRLYGYDRLPNTLPVDVMQPGSRSKEQVLIQTTHQTAQALGFQETINYALTTDKKAVMTGMLSDDVVTLEWPMSEEHAVLRQNLISGLLDTIQYNLARKNKDLALYEIGKVFYKKDATYHERQHVAFAVTGAYQQADFANKGTMVDFFTLKGQVDEYLARQNFADEVRYLAAELPEMHPGRTANIYVGEVKVGFIGQIHPATAKMLDLTETYVAELDLTTIVALAKQAMTATEISKYPAVTRDIALVVDKIVDNATIEANIREKAGKYLTNITLFDVYAGSNMHNDKKSMAYTLTFQKNDATLKDEEIENWMAKIIAHLEAGLNAEIR